MATIKLREPTQEKATLKEAAENDNVHLLQELTSRGVNVTGFVDDANNTALHFAALEGSNKVITFLLDNGAGINDVDKFQFTPLHRAATSGCTDSVALLAARGADINMKNLYNMTPVELAVYKGHSATVYHFVKTLGMDITKFAEKENRDKASKLVKKEEKKLQGSPAPNNVQATAISQSSVKVTWDQLSDATVYIISYSTTASPISGGNVTVEGTCGTLNGLVENTSYTITVQAMNSYARKIAVSSEVSVITSEKATIKEAAENDNVHILQELTSRGVNVTGFVDDTNSTALHFAALECSNNVIAFLLDNGARINDVDKFQFTPLHRAATNGCTDSVDLLVARGADINMKSMYNKTPLEHAVANGHSATVYHFVKTLGMDITKIAEKKDREKASRLVKKEEKKQAKPLQKSGSKQNKAISAKPSQKSGTKRSKDSSETASNSPGAKRTKIPDSSDDGGDEKCSEILEKIRANFAKLTRSFPMDGLVAELYSKKVITDDEKVQLEVKKLKKEKVSFLFVEVINPELHAGDSTKFDSLIKVMEASGDNTAIQLAKLLR